MLIVELVILSYLWRVLHLSIGGLNGHQLVQVRQDIS